MVKFFDKEVTDKWDWLELMGNHLSGSCMNTVDGCLNDEDFLPGIKFWNITEDEFNRYLEDHGIYECNTCGWWTYEGEGDGTDCDDCHDDKAEQDDE